MKAKMDVSNMFNQDSDDEQESKKPKTAYQLYGNKYEDMKAKRVVNRAISEDPSVYEYDSIYEKLEIQKNEKVLEQREADKNRECKYIKNMLAASKKRELEQLVRDENTYKKEREAEAGQFDDKEVFITPAYRRQLEEREKYKKEMEKEDAVNSKGSFLK